jgi:hypothetical protein
VDVGYRLNPGHEGFLGNRVEYRTRIHVNSDGLRGEATGPVDCRFRIIIIGDSFVFGQGVEASDAIAVKLQEDLQARGIPTEVMNAGVRGYGTAQEVAWLRKYGMTLSPDIVVMGVFMGNDIQDNLLAPADHRGLASVLARQSGEWWHNRVTEWLYENSHLYGLLRDLPRHLKMHRTSTGLVDTTYLSKAYEAATSAERTEALAHTATAVDEFARITREAGVEPMAVLIPDELQVAPWRLRLAKEVASEGTRLDFDYPRRIFADLFTRDRIMLLDLTAPFRDATNGGKILYYPVDHHWNRLGHDMAALVLADFLHARLHEGFVHGRTGLRPPARRALREGARAPEHDPSCRSRRSAGSVDGGVGRQGSGPEYPSAPRRCGGSRACR